ncbi:DUF3800 domain-containing protein [Thioclava atlantica]|uniref:DUF3800 domain-containing protein n=1 Tax=Thioclava atlantica TaxID=1317124 RepID=UPI00138E4A1E|nr:DUF3800 domain-containing protein [Thioclava atlantica]
MFQIFLDESGTYKIETASRDTQNYLVLTAAVVPDEEVAPLRALLEKIRDKGGDHKKKPLHSNTIKLPKLLGLVKDIENFNFTLISVISCKKSILNSDDGYWKEKAVSNNWAYASTIHRLLFERVGMLMEKRFWNSPEKEKSISGIKIFAEQHTDIREESINKYLNTCRNNPKDKFVSFLGSLPPFNMKQKSKEEEPLLWLADVASYAVANTLLDGKRKHVESDLLRHIAEKYWHNEDDGSMLELGLRFIPSAREVCKSPRELHLFTRSLPMEICDVRAQRAAVDQST